MRVLLLIPHKLSPDRHDAVRAGKRPQADYDALASSIAALPNARADILDLDAVFQSRSWLVWLARRFFGKATALAMLGHRRAQGYDVVFSHGETVAIPFAVLSHFRWRRPPFVSNAYYLVGRRNEFWHKVLRVHRKIDRLILFSREQHRIGRDALGIPERKLLLIDQCGFVDSEFFGAPLEDAVDECQICSNGLEHRDYDVLIRAAAMVPEARVKIDPASPWSIHTASIDPTRLPSNVEICRKEIGASRGLYAQSVAVAVPLRDNSIGAGSTTVAEAMLGGKPVIATCGRDGTFAGRPDLVDGENIVLVPVGDVDAWCAALRRILTDRPFRIALSRGARRWAEQYAQRARWVGQNLEALQTVVLERQRTKRRSASGTPRLSRAFRGRLGSAREHL